MLPLSIWSWQDTIKAVLSGKAVVVDIHPNIFVRAVSLDMPVPSVIALREYAPTGKAVRKKLLHILPNNVLCD
jgi:5-methylcytosine-specific restriction endonuclease McrA